MPSSLKAQLHCFYTCSVHWKVVSQHSYKHTPPKFKPTGIIQSLIQVLNSLQFSDYFFFFTCTWMQKRHTYLHTNKHRKQL